jgi:hypothetical protein
MSEKFYKYLAIVWMIIVGVGIIYGFIRFLLGLEIYDWLTLLIVIGALFIGAIIKLFSRVSSLEKRIDKIERNT